MYHGPVQCEYWKSVFMRTKDQCDGLTYNRAPLIASLPTCTFVKENAKVSESFVYLLSNVRGAHVCKGLSEPFILLLLLLEMYVCFSLCFANMSSYGSIFVKDMLRTGSTLASLNSRGKCGASQRRVVLQIMGYNRTPVECVRG